VVPQAGPSTESYVALSDCEDQLLFVTRLAAPRQSGLPGGIDIFDLDGGLAAHGIVDDPVVARYQFVDANGFLLATSEAPGLQQNIPMKDLPLDGRKGNVLPYALRFEQGGYVNASRLLEVDYRWALAAALQARALADAHAGWAPRAASAVEVLYWCLAAFGLLACLCACGAVYRVVYPMKGNERLWAPGKPGQPEPWSYSSLAKTL